MKVEEKIVTILLTGFCCFACISCVSAQTAKDPQTPTPRTEVIGSSFASLAQIKKHIVELDAEFQQAVKIGDTRTIDRIVADDFVLVNGRGEAFSKVDLLKTVREGKIVYERQEDSDQAVRVWGDTAIITALLWAKGTKNGEPFEYKVWFSDVYKLTPTGWRYVFAQVSLRLPSKN